MADSQCGIHLKRTTSHPLAGSSRGPRIGNGSLTAHSPSHRIPGRYRPGGRIWGYGPLWRARVSALHSDVIASASPVQYVARPGYWVIDLCRHVCSLNFCDRTRNKRGR